MTRVFHPEELALLAAIHAESRDDTPRLVYADWLQENEQEEYAEFIRMQVALANARLSNQTPSHELLTWEAVVLSRTNSRHVAWADPRPPSVTYVWKSPYDRGLPVLPFTSIISTKKMLEFISGASPRLRYAMKIDASRVGELEPLLATHRIEDCSVSLIPSNPFGEPVFVEDGERARLTVDDLLRLPSLRFAASVTLRVDPGQISDSVLSQLAERLMPFVPTSIG